MKLKRKQLHILALMAAMLLAACSEEAAVTGQPGDDAMQQLTFNVTETSWDGENINVTTRSGETMEGLKGTYPAKSWNFTSVADKEALLSMSDGLTFAPLNGDDDKLTVVDVDAAKAVKLHGTLIVRNLKAGQEVTIVFKTTDTPRILGFSNLTKPSGFTPPTTAKQTGRGTVGANGDVVFTTTGPMYIYSINVTEATDEGFGLYCSELEYTNTQVKWSDAEGRWHIGENNYPTYWQSNQSGSLNIYAYAPYKAGGYTVSDNKLTFNAEKHPNMGLGMDFSALLSGSNVDLLHAYTTHERTNINPATLTFNHKLAKLTFGTLTNNTGETITLEGFTVRGTLNSSAKLNLSTGVWSDHESSEASITLPPPFVEVVHSEAEMEGAPSIGYTAKALIKPLADGETTIPNMPSNSVLLIPNGNREITVNVDVNNSTGEKFSFHITLEEGKEKIVNITVEKNFEVVIEEGN